MVVFMKKGPLIPHVRLTIGAAEIAAVTKVLRSGQLAMGSVSRQLEKQLALLSKQKYAAVVSSGTAALHLALLALGVKTGDEVIIPAYSCQALLNAVKQAGAEPRLVDINLETFNLDPEAVKKGLTPKVKAIIVPHMFGLMADIAAIKKFGLPVIEDCAMGLGATLLGHPAGSFGDLATFSFYATKTVTGGEGGLIVSSRVSLIEFVDDTREYDKKKDFRVRYNYKLSDLNAAVAVAQLKKLKLFIKQRQAIAKRYHQALKNTNLILPVAPAGYEHSFSRYVIRLDQAAELRSYLLKHGVQTGRGVVLGANELIATGQRYPNSEQALKTAVSLPIYPTLTAAEQRKIIKLLLNF